MVCPGRRPRTGHSCTSRCCRPSRCLRSASSYLRSGPTPSSSLSWPQPSRSSRNTGCESFLARWFSWWPAGPSQTATSSGPAAYGPCSVSHWASLCSPPGPEGANPFRAAPERDGTSSPTQPPLPVELPGWSSRVRSLPPPSDREAHMRFLGEGADLPGRPPDPGARLARVVRSERADGRRSPPGGSGVPRRTHERPDECFTQEDPPSGKPSSPRDTSEAWGGQAMVRKTTTPWSSLQRGAARITLTANSAETYG